MGIPSDRRFLATARKRLVHLFPVMPTQSAYHKRRRRLSAALEWLRAHFAADSPGFSDDLLLCDSTPVECGRSRETAKRSALGEAAGYGYCAARTRWCWGFRLHLLAAPDGTPRAFTLADPRRDRGRRPLLHLPDREQPDLAGAVGTPDKPVHPLTWPRSDRVACHCSSRGH